VAPESLDEALSIMTRERGGVKIIAGGTDLLVKIKKRESRYQKLLGLKRISNLDYVLAEKDFIRLGPLVTHEMAAKSPVLKEYTPILTEACGDLGSYQIRCMGTVAGNICNASPSADSVPPLLTLQACIRVVSTDGERVLPLDQIFVGPFETVLQDHEIVASIEIPKPPVGSRGIYLKMPKITEKDETLVGVAVLLKREASGKLEEIRIGLGSVAQTPIRARKTEAFLRGRDPEDQKTLREAKNTLIAEISPRSRADYRKRITGYLFEEGVRIVLTKN